MVIIEKEGNLLDSSTQIIIQQVNCKGVMGSGVAKVIKEKYPIVYEKYIKFYNKQMEEMKSTYELLGLVQPVKISENQTILNIFAQNEYGYDGKRYTSYDALDTCLRKVCDYCQKNNIQSIALPYKMASDRGGACWNIVMEIIKDSFKDSNITIEIWKFKQLEHE